MKPLNETRVRHDREVHASDGIKISEEELVGHEQARQSVEKVLVDQSWIDEWQQGTFDFNEAAVAWLRERPQCIWPLMIQFPPNCIVRANRVLYIPIIGTCGIVTSYFEPSEQLPKGGVSVRQDPNAGVQANCEPDWLKVMGYWKGLTPDVMRKLLV